MGRAAFFAPDISIAPASFFPPDILYISNVFSPEAK
jgi:hypothetical protein